MIEFQFDTNFYYSLITAINKKLNYPSTFRDFSKSSRLVHDIYFKKEVGFTVTPAECEFYL